MEKSANPRDVYRAAEEPAISARALEATLVTVSGSYSAGKGNHLLGPLPGGAAETLGRKLSIVPAKGHER